MTDSLQGQAIPMLPLRPAVLAFLGYVRDMIEVMQKQYGMTYEQAIEDLNARLGAREGHPAVVLVWDHEASWVWWHETPEHMVRCMYEGMYWYRDKMARKRVEEWQAETDHTKAVHEHLNWTAEQYAKWVAHGTLPPPPSVRLWEL